MERHAQAQLDAPEKETAAEIDPENDAKAVMVELLPCPCRGSSGLRERKKLLPASPDQSPSQVHALAAVSVASTAPVPTPAPPLTRSRSLSMPAQAGNESTEAALRQLAAKHQAEVNSINAQWDRKVSEMMAKLPTTTTFCERYRSWRRYRQRYRSWLALRDQVYHRRHAATYTGTPMRPRECTAQEQLQTDATSAENDDSDAEEICRAPSLWVASAWSSVARSVR